MASHTVLSHADWLEARKALLAKEKEFTRARANARKPAWRPVVLGPVSGASCFQAFCR